MSNARRRAYLDDRPNDLDRELWDWFTGQTDSMPADAYYVHDLPRLFRAHERAIVRQWDNPGTRPPLWWQWCAPEPRRKLSGSGLRRQAHWPACVPIYRNGIPADYIETDPADPPTYEAQGVYLARLGLLLDGEEAGDTTPERIGGG